MSDESVRQAVRSDARLVAIGAPAGCGKTYQGADYVVETVAAAGTDRTLILTHTHAACSVFAERTRAASSRVEIRTIDSVIASVAGAYRVGIGLNVDPATWARREENGHDRLAIKVAALLERHPMITAAMARRYPVIVCDEHQDSSGDQHKVVMALHKAGARVRLFADPMQKIFPDSEVEGASDPYDWNSVVSQADAVADLDYPHRWHGANLDLGKWTLEARKTLKAGGKVDLRQVPSGVHVVRANNVAERNLDFRLDSADRAPIDRFQRRQSSLLILTRHNETAKSLRSFFDRRIPLWEGYTRLEFEKLVDIIQGGASAPQLARAVVAFINELGKGFSPGAFGNQFERQVAEGCTGKMRGVKPPLIQQLARFIVDEPDHRGVAKMLQRLAQLNETEASFADIKIDLRREFFDAVRLGQFETAEAGLAEITHRRTYSRPKPPERAISTVHKAKGLECDGVLLLPCDSRTFPEKENARCLAYVALSRAKKELMIVVSPNHPSPLFII